MSFYDFEKTDETKLPYFDNFVIAEIDGYGMYTLRLERGTAPKEFDGKFTSLERVRELVKLTETNRRAKSKKPTE